MRKTDLIYSIVTVFILSACSATQGYQNRTGFFNNYSGFEQVGQGSPLYFHKESDANLSSYHKILVPDIQILPHSAHTTPEDNRLYAQISAYTTAAYRKNIIKNSANYKLVDVAQKDTMVIQIAISMVEFHPEDKSWDPLSALPFTLDATTYSVYTEGNARLLVEARISDAMNGRMLAGSMRIVQEERITIEGDHLQFNDLQPALDTWLYEVMLKH